VRYRKLSVASLVVCWLQSSWLIGFDGRRRPRLAWLVERLHRRLVAKFRRQDRWHRRHLEPVRDMVDCVQLCCRTLISIINSSNSSNNSNNTSSSSS
jgi:hypothetical protein